MSESLLQLRFGRPKIGPSNTNQMSAGRQRRDDIQGENRGATMKKFVLGLQLFVICLGLAAVFSLGFRWYRTKYPAEGPAPEPAAEIPLPEKEREYLWDLEHHFQLLSQRGFSKLAAALKQANDAKLRKLFAEKFDGAVASQVREIQHVSGEVQIVRQESQGQPLQPANRDEMVDLLLKHRKDFAKPPGVSISVISLSPQKRYQLDSPVWEGTAALRMWGETSAKAPKEVALSLCYRLARPSDELFKKDGWLQMCHVLQTQVARSPHYLFREVAAERGIDPKLFHDNWTSPSEPRRTQTGGVYLCDFDRDGILDMLVVDVKGCRLFKGLDGGKFKDVTRASGLPMEPPEDLSPVAFADLDGDGWDDLILGEKVFQNVPDKRGGRRFLDVTKKTNLRFPPYCSAVSIADYDRDGLLDIYTTAPGEAMGGSWVSGKSGDGRTNQLFRNKGNWQFEDVTKASGTGGSNRSCFSSVWLDANNDGWPDLYIINEFGNGLLLVNQGNGKFKEVVLSKNQVEFGAMGVNCGSFANDGNIDIYSANMYSKAGTRVIGNMRPDAYDADVMSSIRHFVTGSQLWKNNGKLKFERKGQDWQIHSVGWAYGAALADLDNDGFLDIYATAGFISADRNEPDG
jgi:hypothetical protein